MRELRECFLEAYDENADGRIEISEVSRSSLSLVRLARASLRFSILLVSRDSADRRELSLALPQR